MPGKLCRPECLRVWREHTNDHHLLKVLTTGLELPLLNGIWPEQYDCKGNHIKDFPAWARKAVNELVEMGSVTRWDDFIKDFPAYAHGAQPRMVMALIASGASATTRARSASSFSSRSSAWRAWRTS